MGETLLQLLGHSLHSKVWQNVLAKFSAVSWNDFLQFKSMHSSSINLSLLSHPGRLSKHLGGGLSAFVRLVTAAG